MSNNSIEIKDIQHLRYLDALRGFAVLGVILVHCTLLTQQTGKFLVLGFAGQRGVQLFYIISAFTLFHSLGIRKNESQSLLNFFIRRFFRIAPLYYFAIILNLIYQGIPQGLHIFDIILGFFFLNGFSPKTINSIAIGGWSIAVEATFYILVPFLFRYITTYTKILKLTLLSIIISFSITRLLSHYLGPDYYEFLNFLSFPIEFPIFCLGILTFKIWEGGTKKLSLSEVAGLLNRKNFSALMLLLSCIILISNLPFSNRNLHLTSFGYVPLLLGLSIFEWPLLVNKLTLFLGKISYSIYLMHFFVIIGVQQTVEWLSLRYFLNHLGSPILLLVFFLATTITSVIVCYITYNLIEKPGINLGKRLIRKMELRNKLSSL